MRLEINNRGQRDITLVMRHHQEERLASTCFRKTRRFAGNFAFWTKAEEVFNDPLIREHLVDEIEEADRLNELHVGLCIDTEKFVGWTSTDTLAKYQMDDLVTFRPNKRSVGLLVKRERKDILAPKTTLLTVVFEIRRERFANVAVIHTLYPGEDVGELHGNVSERERCVFFDWKHPGSHS